jgi:hypothetical protein
MLAAIVLGNHNSMYGFIRLAIVILAFDFAAPAAAQDVAADMDFRGVSAIHITASPMSVESIDCNIDGSYLVRELQRQFEGDGLAKSADFDTLAVITVLSAREGGSGPCNSAVMLGAYKKASFFDNEAAWLRTGYVVIWQSALLVASPADTHLVLARDSLARLGQVMLKEWKDANSTSQ